MAIKRFLADEATKAMLKSSGLAVSTLSRGESTVDPLGENVIDGVPRFDETVLIAAVPSYEGVGSSTNNGLLLASGVNHNGTTALLLYLNDTSHRLDV